jgi:hypothetical protein
MYIVTFIQSDSNNIDSNLCCFTQEVFKKVKEFFTDSLLDGLQECEAYLTDAFASEKEDFTFAIGFYITLHIQALNSYSRKQLSLVNQHNQQTPLAPQESLKQFVVAATLPDNTEVVLGRFDTIEDARLFGDIAYISVKHETDWDLEKILRVVKVVLEDGDSFTTSITGTKKTIEEYYAIGKLLNMGVAEDRMVAIKELHFLS